MLNPADVLKIKCNFVNKVLALINKRKYVASVCPCVLYPSYGEYAQVSVVDPECLSIEQECALNNTNYDAIPSCEPVILDCDNQLDITTTIVGKSCAVAISMDNKVDGTAYPIMSTSAGSPLITGTTYIKFLQSGDCGANLDYDTVLSGTTSSGTSDSYQSTYSFGFNSLNTFHGSNQSYISILRVYQTDSLGTLVNTPINLDLDPSTSPYYSDNVDCPSCSALLSTDVEIGNPDFSTNFSILMDNVSIALLGDPGLHYITASSGGNDYRVYCKAVQNPTTQMFGINNSDAYILVTDGASGTNYVQTKTNASLLTPARFYHESSYDLTDPVYECAGIDPIIINDQWTLPNVNTSATSFNKIVLNNSFGTKTINITSGSSSSCGIDVLKALYDDTLVEAVDWRDPSTSVISETSTAIPTINGEYVFRAYLTNGCVASKTTRYPA